MIEKEFVPYQESLELKKLGFNEECFWWYDFEKYLRKDRIGTSTNYSYFLENNSCSAPTYSQAFRWFRDKYDLRSWIESFNKTNYKAVILNHYGSTFNSNEEAELECLRKLIELVKNK